MRRTHEEYVASLEYKLADIKEALLAAAAMDNWRGVVKYAEQAMRLEPRLWDARASVGPKRMRRTPWMHGEPGTTAGEVFGRGGRWKR